MTSARYIDRLRDADVLTIAAQLGIEIIESRGTSPGSFACPACNAERRHGERIRGACGVTANGCGWRCFECGVTGDAIGLVHWVLCGRAQEACSATDKAKVRAWVDRRDGVEPRERPPLRLVRKPPEYPPAEKIARVWAECVRVDEEPDVCHWLRSKRVDVDLVADRDLARALPSDSSEAPKWARGGWRLIVPLRDADGAMRSLKARRIVSGDGPKSLSPSGHSAVDLAFFDPHIAAAERAFFIEGEKKLLQVTTLFPEAMVIGVGSGMITAELVARVPAGAEVLLCTDPNGAGAEYATKLARLLAATQRKRAQLWRGLEVPR